MEASTQGTSGDFVIRASMGDTANPVPGLSAWGAGVLVLMLAAGSQRLLRPAR